MRQFQLMRHGHESPRTVVLFPGQIILQTQRKDCGCNSCKEQDNKIQSDLKANNIEYFFEHVNGTPFLRIIFLGVEDRSSLINFLENKLNFSIESLEKVEFNLPVHEDAPRFRNLCGEMAKNEFALEFLHSIMATCESDALETIIKDAKSSKFADEKILDDFYSRAYSLREKFPENYPDSSFQKDFKNLRDDVLKFANS